jgi:hypothetical protein
MNDYENWEKIEWLFEFVMIFSERLYLDGLTGGKYFQIMHKQRNW